MAGTMKYRPLGATGISASVVGLGTSSIGGWLYGEVEEKDAVAAVQASLDRGINLVDTAPFYGFGLAEEVVARAIKGRRDKVLVATKVGLVWEGSEGEYWVHAKDRWQTDGPSKYIVYKNLKPHSIFREVEMSLKRLNTDYIDLYQTHLQETTAPIDATLEALNKLRDQGKIRAIGVSDASLERLAQYGPVASFQEKFSLVNRSIETNGIIDYCEKHNIAVLSCSALERGLLTGMIGLDRDFPENDERRRDRKFAPQNRSEVLSILSSFKPFAEKYGVTITQLVIALTAAQRGITHVLVGARNTRQAIENAGGGCVELMADDMSAMKQAFDRVVIEDW